MIEILHFIKLYERIKISSRKKWQKFRRGSRIDWTRKNGWHYACFVAALEMNPRLFLRGCAAPLTKSLCSRNNDPATRLTILETRLDWGSMTRTTSLHWWRRAPSRNVSPQLSSQLFASKTFPPEPAASPFNLPRGRRCRKKNGRRDWNPPAMRYRESVFLNAFYRRTAPEYTTRQTSSLTVDRIAAINNNTPSKRSNELRG